MVKVQKTEMETFSFRVRVLRCDIDGGKCRDPHRCMERLAIMRELDNLLGENKATRVRLDAAQIKFNYDGYRWYATTPKKAKVSLIQFDRNQPVQPHEYTVTAIKGTKIQKVTAERQKQVNLARKARREAGTPDKPRTAKSLHERVVGLGAV
jgi:hypothetical protein